MSLKPLLNAAVFQQRDMWQFVFSLTQCLMRHSVSSLRNSPHHPLSYIFLPLYISQMGKILTLNREENKKHGDDHFGIIVLLEYGMRIAVY